MIFNSSETSRLNDYQSAIKLDIPPGYKTLSIPAKNNSLNVKKVADLFLENMAASAINKLGLKYNADGQEIIYIIDSEENIIRKLQTNPSGTLIQYTWHGKFRERLQFASKNNSFNPPGFSKEEVKNLYH